MQTHRQSQLLLCTVSLPPALTSLAGQGPKYPFMPARVLDQQALFQKNLFLIYTWKGTETALHHKEHVF